MTRATLALLLALAASGDAHAQAEALVTSSGATLMEKSAIGALLVFAVGLLILRERQMSETRKASEARLDDQRKETDRRVDEQNKRYVELVVESTRAIAKSEETARETNETLRDLRDTVQRRARREPGGQA